MALKFAGKTVRCGSRHTDLIDTSPDVHFHEQWFWGGLGLSEIRGGIGGRDVSCVAWIYRSGTWDSASDYKQLWKYIDDLRSDKWLLKHGTVSCSGTVSGTSIKRKIKDCTLRSVSLVAMPGQDDARPINGIDQEDWNSWVMPVRFVWRRVS